MPTMGMTSEQAADAFECSLVRCREAGDFIGAFYERFVGSSKTAQEKFAQTDLSVQKKVLETSLHMMTRACLGRAEGLDHLESVARSHSKRHLDIAPSLYNHWLETLIATARDFDGEFSERVEKAWRQSLERSIARMVEVYRQEETVRPPR